MIIIKGHTYRTITDAAGELGVSAKTVRSYISKQIIPVPPVIQYGNRTVYHFSSKYMNMAKKQLDIYRAAKTTRD